MTTENIKANINMIPTSWPVRGLHRLLWLILVALPSIPLFLVLVGIAKAFSLVGQGFMWLGLQPMRWAFPMENLLSRWLPLAVPNVTLTEGTITDTTIRPV
jgi:hypothetical protein